MKISTVPIICGVALTAMSTATLSHWWSVRQFVAAVGNPLPAPLAPASTPNRLVAAPPAKTHAPATPAAAKTPAVAAAVAKPHQTTSQKDFYEALISKMNSLQTQNRDLLDQLAETNRDLMKLEFRVDTHSESFRPLPVSEEQPFTSLEDGPGVLPPRAEPVQLPSYE